MVVCGEIRDDECGAVYTVHLSGARVVHGPFWLFGECVMVCCRKRWREFVIPPWLLFRSRHYPLLAACLASGFTNSASCRESEDQEVGGTQAAMAAIMNSLELMARQGDEMPRDFEDLCRLLRSHHALSSHGLQRDAWETPYILICSKDPSNPNRAVYTLRSAGRDRVMNTRDDLTCELRLSAQKPGPSETRPAAGNQTRPH